MAEEKKITSSFEPTFKICASDDLSKDWFVEYYDERGNRQKKYKGINQHTTYQARMNAAIALRDQLAATYTVPVTTEKQIWEYLETLKPSEEERLDELRPKTYTEYCSIVRVFMRWLAGQEPTPVLAQTYMEKRRKELAAKTFNKQLWELKSLFGHIGKAYLFDGITTIKGAKGTPSRFYNNQQREQLSNLLRDRDYTLWIFVQFVYYCFIRPQSELRRLKVENILWEDDAIFIPANIAKGKRQRYVEIPDAFKPALQVFLKDKKPSEYLFPSPKFENKPVGKDVLTRHFRVILKELGYETNFYKLYGWKHTGNRAAVRSGASLDELREQNGHASIAQTAEYLQSIGVKEPSKLKKVMPKF